MQTIRVELGERSYPIQISPSLLQSADFRDHIRGRQCLVVTNEVVAPLYLESVVNRLAEQGFSVDSIILSDGETGFYWWLGIWW